jgi:LacI family transcriptional regulator
MKVRIQDVAEAAGVSVCTVSRVFNKHPHVKPAVAAKVLEVARRLNYKPKFRAVESRIAVLVESSWSLTQKGYEGALLSSVLRTIVAQGFGFEIIPVRESNFQFERFATACVAILYKSSSIEMARRLRHIPLVLINHEEEGFHSVCAEHRQGLELAVEHLADLGHRRIGYLSSSVSTWGGAERLAGYESVLASHGLPVLPELISFAGGTSLFEGIAQICRHRPTGLIVSGEENGAAAVYNLHLLGKTIPDDISLITFESEGLSRFLLPPCTTVSQELEKVGATAAQVAIDLINKDSASPITIRLANKLIIRQSTQAI